MLGRRGSEELFYKPNFFKWELQPIPSQSKHLNNNPNPIENKTSFGHICDSLVVLFVAHGFSDSLIFMIFFTKDNELAMNLIIKIKEFDNGWGVHSQGPIFLVSLLIIIIS